jgi:hypothetical protein
VGEMDGNKDLFECDKYGKECDSLFKWVVRIILVAGVAFLFGLNCATVLMGK